MTTAPAERLTTAEAAALLGCHPQHVRALIKAEKLPATRIAHPRGDYYEIDADAVRAYRPDHPRMGRKRHAPPKL